MTGPRFTDKQKALVDQDKKIAANYLFWEDKLPFYKIEAQLKIGHATLDRLLLSTFQEWRRFRNGLGKT